MKAGTEVKPNSPGNSNPVWQPQFVNGNGDPQYQTAVRAFETALRQFQRKNMEKARAGFEKLARSQFSGIADRARLHLRLCQQRLAQRGALPKTAADFYLLGLTELNSRILDLAIVHLAKADRLAPRHDHIQYALAAAYALEGKVELAIPCLRAAIELRPENAFQARTDRDFAKLTADLRFQALVRSASSRSIRVFAYA